jgi:hypothetical protein
LFFLHCWVDQSVGLIQWRQDPLLRQVELSILVKILQCFLAEKSPADNLSTHINKADKCKCQSNLTLGSVLFSV